MSFYKVFIPNGKKVQISKEEAHESIASFYGNRFIDRTMHDLLTKRIVGIGMYWNLVYVPTPQDYCKEQGCESNPDRCGYYPSVCIKDKYGVE